MGIKLILFHLSSLFFLQNKSNCKIVLQFLSNILILCFFLRITRAKWQEADSIKLCCGHPVVNPIVVQLLSCVQLFATPWTEALQASLPSPSPRACSNSCPLSQWCHPAISSSVVPFSSCLQSFPASGSFQRSQLFTSGGQSIGVSALASVLPMNIHPTISSSVVPFSSYLQSFPASGNFLMSLTHYSQSNESNSKELALLANS